MSYHRNFLQETTEFASDFATDRFTEPASPSATRNGFPKPEEPKIGIALSGGGVRAAVFHLGVLSHLAGQGLLEKVTAISTVSGGSLLAGLVFSLSGNRWPTSQFFLDECITLIRDRLTHPKSIQRDLITSFARRPWQIRNRDANQLADSIRRCWGITGELNDLTMSPRWIINATTYETGKNWRFIPHRSMGDYSIGYVKTPAIPIADAIAASAAVPGLIGNYSLAVDDYNWYNFTDQERVTSRPQFEKLHLWDGSVYDFLGTESLFKIGMQPYPDDVNTLIVSDAAQPLEMTSARSPVHERAQRLVMIATDQVRSLRTRIIVNHFRRNPGSGAFLKIGTTVDPILFDDLGPLPNGTDHRHPSINGSPAHEVSLARPTINRRDAEWAASMETTLRQITRNEFELIFQHGWEVARFSMRNLFPQFVSA